MKMSYLNILIAQALAARFLNGTGTEVPDGLLQTNTRDTNDPFPYIEKESRQVRRARKRQEIKDMMK